MSKLETGSNNNVYLKIVQGELAQEVPEGTPNSRKRDWEAGGEKGTKFELTYKAIVGTIKEVSFYDGEANGRKFTTLNLVLDENEDGKYPVISSAVESRYATDLMKKLPNVDLDEEVRIRPFSFVPEGEDKPVTGVEIMERDSSGNFQKKVSNFFSEKKGDKWVPANGFPTPEGDTQEYSSDDWKVYYLQVKKFLVTYTKTNIIPKLQSKSAATDHYPDEIDPKDIPFE